MPTLTGNQPIENRLFNMQQACRYLGISRYTLRAMVLSGEIKAIRRPGLRTPWLFDRRELDRWIDSHSVSGIPRRR